MRAVALRSFVTIESLSIDVFHIELWPEQLGSGHCGTIGSYRVVQCIGELKIGKTVQYEY